MQQPSERTETIDKEGVERKRGDKSFFDQVVNSNLRKILKKANDGKKGEPTDKDKVSSGETAGNFLTNILNFSARTAVGVGAAACIAAAVYTIMHFGWMGILGIFVYTIGAGLGGMVGAGAGFVAGGLAFSGFSLAKKAVGGVKNVFNKLFRKEHAKEKQEASKTTILKLALSGCESNATVEEVLKLGSKFLNLDEGHFLNEIKLKSFVVKSLIEKGEVNPNNILFNKNVKIDSVGRVMLVEYQRQLSLAKAKQVYQEKRDKILVVQGQIESMFPGGEASEAKKAIDIIFGFCDSNLSNLEKDSYLEKLPRLVRETLTQFIKKEFGKEKLDAYLPEYLRAKEQSETKDENQIHRMAYFATNLCEYGDIDEAKRVLEKIKALDLAKGPNYLETVKSVSDYISKAQERAVANPGSAGDVAAALQGQGSEPVLTALLSKLREAEINITEDEISYCKKVIFEFQVSKASPQGKDLFGYVFGYSKNHEDYDNFVPSHSSTKRLDDIKVFVYGVFASLSKDEEEKNFYNKIKTKAGTALGQEVHLSEEAAKAASGGSPTLLTTPILIPAQRGVAASAKGRSVGSDSGTKHDLGIGVGPASAASASRVAAPAATSPLRVIAPVTPAATSPLRVVTPVATSASRVVTPVAPAAPSALGGGPQRKVAPSAFASRGVTPVATPAQEKGRGSDIRVESGLGVGASMPKVAPSASTSKGATPELPFIDAPPEAKIEDNNTRIAKLEARLKQIRDQKRKAIKDYEERFGIGSWADYSSRVKGGGSQRS